MCDSLEQMNTVFVTFWNVIHLLGWCQLVEQEREREREKRIGIFVPFNVEDKNDLSRKKENRNETIAENIYISI